MQTQKGSVVLFSAVMLTSIVIGLVWVHISDESPKVRADATTSAKKPRSANICTQNAAGKEVLVSISRQHMWACSGTSLVHQSAVTTGASNAPNDVHDGTPVGTWHIYEKYRNLYLKGGDKNGMWNDYVQYWMPFDTAVGFHDASWQTFPFGSQQYKTDGSHGCVQLPTGIAAWLYGWAPVGTTVVVSA